MTDASQRGEVVVVQTISAEYVGGFQVAAWRYNNPGDDLTLGYGPRFATHWSTPGAGAKNVERLFTETQLRACLAASPPAPSGDSGAWEALERIAKLTPGAANAATARDLHLSVADIARQALALRDAGGGSLPAVCAEDVARAARKVSVWIKCGMPDQSDNTPSRDALKRDLETILSLLPGAGGVGPLWAMHVRGPDDVYAAPDYDTALAWCDEANKLVASVGSDVLFSAVPALWTGSAEEHAASFPEAIKGWTLPAAPTSEGSSALRPSDCVPSGDVDGGAGR